MTGNKFKFINITPYENNDINWDKELFNINYDEEYLGAIPDNMKNDIFESISKKLHNYLNDTK